MRRGAALATAAIAACSFPTKHPGADDAAGPSDAIAPVDAAIDGGPFSCSGAPPPTTAPPTITITGDALDLGTGSAASQLEVQGIAAGKQFFDIATDGSGHFVAQVDTGGSAIDGHVESVPGTFVPSLFFPAHAFDADTSIALPMLTSDELVKIGNPPATAFLEILLGDCDGTGLAGCTLVMQPPPMTLEYISGNTPSSTATETDASGGVIVFGAPTDPTIFTASCKTGSLHPKTIALDPDSTYLVLLGP